MKDIIEANNYTFQKIEWSAGYRFHKYILFSLSNWIAPCREPPWPAAGCSSDPPSATISSAASTLAAADFGMG
jgi:hypothetical protein